MISRESVRKRWMKGKRIMKSFSRWMEDEPDKRDIGRAGTTPAVCSCSMCGNPRKHYGNKRSARTIQEQRAMQECKL